MLHTSLNILFLELLEFEFQVPTFFYLCPEPEVLTAMTFMCVLFDLEDTLFGVEGASCFGTFGIPSTERYAEMFGAGFLGDWEALRAFSLADSLPRRIRGGSPTDGLDALLLLPV